MKIKTTTTTEIEASAEELRQSNTLSEVFTNILRRAMIPSYMACDSDDDDEDGEQDDTDR